MSLLEDIFLQDEADEAQELERVIEGDEFDERPRSRSGSPDSDENVNRDDEAEEDKRRVDPSSTKATRVTKNPRFILNPARLTGPRGIQIIPDHFKDFRFKGKGHEKQDLDMLLKKLEHWAYRLYPKFQFEDCLKKIETLGKKRPVMVHLQKIRTDQYISEDIVAQKDSSDDETETRPPQEEDEFDKLLQQQIELARATPAPGSVNKVMATPRQDRSPFTMPKATSSPSISDEQKERMMRNRRLAEERRLARLKQNSFESEKQDNSKNISEIIEVDEKIESYVTVKKTNRSLVIDSSDDECDLTSVNQAVTVDVHSGTNVVKTSDKNNGESGNDIEMDHNVDRNDVIEIVQDVVEIPDNDNNMDKTVDLTKEVANEIIKINDQVNEEIIEINDKVVVTDKIIKINDEVTKLNENEIIEINDPIEIIRISSNTEVGKENNSNLIIDLNEDDHPPQTTEIVDDNNITENQQNVTEESTQGHDSIQNDFESKKSQKDGDLEQNDNLIAEELTEDIMDVDFSDDF